MIELLIAIVESRRKVLRAKFAISQLRYCAADARRSGDRKQAQWLDRLADMIEATP